MLISQSGHISSHDTIILVNSNRHERDLIFLYNTYFRYGYISADMRSPIYRGSSH